MGFNDPSSMRWEAARVFVDVARVGDSIAIIDFDGDARILAELQRIESEADRDSLKAVVSNVDSAGTTNLNEALNGGYAQLSLDQTANKKVAILLTDGRQDVGNVPPYDNNSHLQYETAGWSIYTVALGDDTDTELLQLMASATGGQFLHLDNPAQMQTVYAEISFSINDSRLLYENSVWLETGQTEILSMNVPPRQDETTFLVGWPGSTVSMWLTDPTGLEITPELDVPGVRHAKGLTYEMYVIRHPTSGTWQLHLYGNDLPLGGEAVEVRIYTEGKDLVYLPMVADTNPNR